MYNFAAVLKERPELVARTSILWRSIMIGYRLYHIPNQEGGSNIQAWLYCQLFTSAWYTFNTFFSGKYCITLFLTHGNPKVMKKCHVANSAIDLFNPNQ